MKKLINIIEKLEGISGWKIIEKQTESLELFFIRDHLDMNRRKKVKKSRVTIYKDFTADDKKFRGSSTIDIYPAMNEIEIKNALENAAFAATLVKNEYYPLVKPEEKKIDILPGNIENQEMSRWIPELVDAVYSSDVYEKGKINSTEFFLNKVSTRICNSEGVEVEYKNFQGEIELITSWQEEGEEVELYRQINFADFDREKISRTVSEMLLMSRDKALAKPTPALEKCPVLLTGDPVKRFFDYYYYQASAQMVYEKVSTARAGESIQGEEINGDSLNLILDPALKGSTKSAPFDRDGFPLKEVNIIEEGRLKTFWGDNRYSYYLNLEPTGNIENVIVQGGKKSLEDLKAGPYLELLAFSNFQLDPLTGNFGGEIRLGRYFDGKEIIPVTGGSVSGNIKNVQQEMFLSREIQQINNFVGPRTVMLHGVSIAGG